MKIRRYYWSVLCVGLLSSFSLVLAQTKEEPQEAVPPPPQETLPPRVETPDPPKVEAPSREENPKEPVSTPQPRPRPKKVRREEVERLKRDIDNAERNLSQIRQRSYHKQEAAQAYQQQITLRQQLVGKYQDQIWVYASQKDSLERSVAQIQTDLISVRRSAQKHATHLYKHGQMHDLILLLSARSINEFLVRVYYLRFFSKQRKQKLMALKTTEMTLQARQNAINGIIQNNEALLQEAKAQQERIEALKKEQLKDVSQLDDKEYRLESGLYQKRRYLENLEAQLQDIAEPDIVYHEPSAESASSPRSSSLSLSIRDILQVTNSHTNTISSSGKGLEIQTGAGIGIKSAHNGVVAKVFVVSNLGNCVALTINDYTVVYGNLSFIAVRKGQNITRGEYLGNSGTDADPLGAKVFVAVLKEGEYVNPLAWLK